MKEWCPSHFTSCAVPHPHHNSRSISQDGGCSVLTWTESTCPEGTSVSSLPVRELDSPSCEGELPCETRHGPRENHCRFLHVHLRALRWRNAVHSCYGGLGVSGRLLRSALGRHQGRWEV
ncbi:hypothetical protein FQN60_010138 [Etheostoma spectabile]|uniref:Uncharacterized protein n=1 Tax=Etheostoma spectabile TaxID=54343 RepID=A0A5J5D6Z1_9PERO|nr:hypothetical protein FQN60_010138 [Etheostoma spectabile]